MNLTGLYTLKTMTIRSQQYGSTFGNFSTTQGVGIDFKR